MCDDTIWWVNHYNFMVAGMGAIDQAGHNFPDILHETEIDINAMVGDPAYKMVYLNKQADCQRDRFVHVLVYECN